jgi:hypothetical protein
VHLILRREVNCVIRVLHRLEAGQLGLIGRHAQVLLLLSLRRDDEPRRAGPDRLGLIDAAPHNAAGDDLVECLENDQPILEVLEEVVHGWLDAERVEPQGEDACLALAFGIEVLDHAVVLGFLLIKRGKSGMRVEEVGDEGEIETGIAGDEGGYGQVFTTADCFRVLQNLQRGENVEMNVTNSITDLLGALSEILGLERPARTLLGLQLVEKNGIVLSVLDILAEVVHSRGVMSQKSISTLANTARTFCAILPPSNDS